MIEKQVKTMITQLTLRMRDESKMHIQNHKSFFIFPIQLNLKLKFILLLSAIIIVSINPAVSAEFAKAEKHIMHNEAAIPDRVAFKFKPRSSREILEASEPEKLAPERMIQKEIEVLIPVFDPNIPESDHLKEQRGIWAELRRVEAVVFANEMKKELEIMDEFSAVRIIPNFEDMKHHQDLKDMMKKNNRAVETLESVGMVGDLYVIGKIIRSNGESIEINISVAGIDGSEWLNRNYKNNVSERFYHGMRNQGRNPYNPAFEKAAADIVEVLKSKSPKYLENLNILGKVVFAYSMSGEYFEDFLGFQGNHVKLLRIPADDDAMYKRALRVQIEDQLFIDNMQQSYKDFNKKTEVSYRTWQEKALAIRKVMHEAEAEAARKRAEVQAEAKIMKEHAEKMREREQAKADKMEQEAEEEYDRVMEEVERRNKISSFNTIIVALSGTFISYQGAREGNEELARIGNQTTYQGMMDHAQVLSKNQQIASEAERITRNIYREAAEKAERAEVRMENQLMEIDRDLQRILNDKAIFGEADFHRQTLMDLGESTDLEVQPHVIKYEGQVIKLTGSAAEQFLEWRRKLRDIYNAEKTPDRGL